MFTTTSSRFNPTCSSSYFSWAHDELWEITTALDLEIIKHISCRPDVVNPKQQIEIKTSESHR